MVLKLLAISQQYLCVSRYSMAYAGILQVLMTLHCLYCIAYIFLYNFVSFIINVAK